MTSVAFGTGTKPWLRSTWTLVAGILALHCYSLFLPFVNQETAFNQAATYFRGGSSENINAFFAAEANSVVVPALGATLSLIFQLGPESGCRILSLLCLAGLVAALHVMLADPSRKAVFVGLALVVLNPLVWTFAGRGTADFAPMALAVMSVALFWLSRDRTGTVIFAALLFAAACLTKIHAILLLPLVALSPEAQSLQQRATLLFVALVAALASVAIYNIAIFSSFGFWFTPPQFAAALAPTVMNVGNNFVRYGGYLALLVLPFSVALAFSHSDRRGILLKLGVICLGMAAGGLLPPSVGEMNFGPFDRWIGSWLTGAVLSALFVVFLLGLFAMKETWVARGRVLSLLLFLLVLSFSRPAQRYLLLILPFYYLMIFRAGGLRRLAVPALAVFVSLNLVVATVQMRTAPAGAANVFGPARQF